MAGTAALVAKPVNAAALEAASGQDCGFESRRGHFHPSIFRARERESTHEGEREMAKKTTPPPRPPAPLTSPKIRHIAGVGLKAPSTLTTKQIRELAASVEAHIEPRKKP